VSDVYAERPTAFKKIAVDIMTVLALISLYSMLQFCHSLGCFVEDWILSNIMACEPSKEASQVRIHLLAQELQYCSRMNATKVGARRPAKY